VNRTLQDRLVKELRLAGIATVDAGNTFLPGFIARFNARLAVAPARLGDLRRPLGVPPGRLGDILCHRELRHVSQRLTVAHDRQLFVLTRDEITERIAGQHVEACHFADRRLDLRWKGLPLPRLAFDKEQRGSSRAAAVENKRLGAALALIKARQGQERPPPRVKTSSEAGGYRPRPPRRAGLLSPAQAEAEPG
jgi:hypothetical protein